MHESRSVPMGKNIMYDVHLPRRRDGHALGKRRHDRLCELPGGLAGDSSAADKETPRALFAQGMSALDAHNYAGVPSVNVGSWSLAAGTGGA